MDARFSFNFDPDGDRIRLARRRLRAAYSLEGGEVPVVEPGGYARHADTLTLLNDYDEMLRHAVAWANALADSDNDWPPFLDTYVGVCMVAEAFGCEVVWTPGEDPWTKPAVADINAVWRLKPVPVGTSHMAKRLMGWIEYAQRAVGSAVPFWTMDIQSPFSVAAHIVEPTELMTACYTAPEAVRHLCSMITDYSIELTLQHIASMENPAFPGRNFPSIPDRIGVCVADDTPLIMLSPDMYREFAMPYNARIAEAFGGIHIHSCGDYSHNLDNLLMTPGVRSIQLHAGPGEFRLPVSAEDPVPFNRARNRVAVFVDTNGVARGDEYRGMPRRHYEEYVIPRLAGGAWRGLILQSCGVGDDMPDVRSALRWTRERARHLGLGR